MGKYGKVSDNEMQWCFHATMETIITANVEFSRVVVFATSKTNFACLKFCKSDLFLVILSDDLYFVEFSLD